MSQHVTDVLEGTRWVFGVRGAKYDMAKIWPTDIHDDHVKNIAFLMDKAGRWSLAPAFDVTYSYNPTGDWTARHQMPMNGKRDGFTLADFRACGKSALMKRGRAEAIVEEVRATVAKWPEYAEQAQVTSDWRKQIQRNHRLNLPRS